MSESERGRSPELDQLRQELFPDLAPEDGWSRIDEAISGAHDPERWKRIEDEVSRAQGSPDRAPDELSSELIARLRELRSDPPGDGPET